MIKFTFVTSECGDWQALYIGNRLAVEGHSVSARDVLDAISNILPNEVERYEVSDKVAEFGMPVDLTDLYSDLIEY